MQGGEKLSLEQIRAMVEASSEVAFAGQRRKETYGWVERVLTEQRYRDQSRSARGLLRQYAAKMTGLSRAQTTRSIGCYLKQGTIPETSYRSGLQREQGVACFRASGKSVDAGGLQRMIPYLRLMPACARPALNQP